jgi:histidinol-phosphate aminotransferase
VGAKATREFLARVNRESPDTTILVDEAYYEYVTDPDHDTHIPIAVENPRVVVARTFSKAYGMAGLRIGYAVGHKDTIKKMADWDAGSGTSSLNVLALHGALAAIQQDPSVAAAERARNKAVRDFAKKWFSDRGMQPTDAQANFMFVNIGRPVKGFRDACRAKGVLVARDFPPFEKTHCRLSFGTMEEMRKAVVVFEEALKKAAA